MPKEQKEQSKTKKEIESLSDRIKASRFSIKDLVVPLAVVVILLLLGLFLFVPMVRTAISYRQQLQEARVREEELNNLEAELRSIDAEEGVFQVDLINSKRVIPQSLTVSSFISYIDTLASEKRLYSRSLTAGDSQSTITRVAQGGDGERERRAYYGVSSRLSYEGSLENVSDFLDNLYTASPYVISARGVSLRGRGEQDWRVEVNVMGYYVPEPTLEIDPYTSFESYKEYQEIIDIFTQKAEQLE